MNKNQRRSTKIIATLGPALADRKVLEHVIAQGYLDVVRVNFSHDEFSFHKDNIEAVREIAKKHNRHIAVLADLQGPKIRIKRFKDDKVFLEAGQRFTLDMKKKDLGDATCVGVDYPDIIHDCKVGDTLLLDDGKISLSITDIVDHTIQTKVLDGGKLSNNKGINLKGGGLSAPAITEKDREVIQFIADLNVEFIAVSFVRSADDMRLVRSLANSVKKGVAPQLIAKIERADIFQLDDPSNHTETLDSIIGASDGVMVARGDLAVEVGAARMVSLQKLITRRAIENNAFVIMATQMMESMITEPQPTRAEISDVGNAILDGADAIMFSAETAIGRDPVRTLETANDICKGAEQLSLLVRHYNVPERTQHTNQAIAYMAYKAACEVKNVKAIIGFTHDGKTIQFLSRYAVGRPIYAITTSESVARQVSILGGVYPLLLKSVQDFHDFRTNHAQQLAKTWMNQGLFKEGDKIIFTYSLFAHPAQHWTNSASILRIEDVAKGFISS